MTQGRHRKVKSGYRGEPNYEANRHRPRKRERLCLAQVTATTRCVLDRNHDGKCKDK
jgi:hypothetical protein